MKHETGGLWAGGHCRHCRPNPVADRKYTLFLFLNQIWTRLFGRSHLQISPRLDAVFFLRPC